MSATKLPRNLTTSLAGAGAASVLVMLHFATRSNDSTAAWQALFLFVTAIAIAATSNPRLRLRANRAIRVTAVTLIIIGLSNLAAEGFQRISISNHDEPFPLESAEVFWFALVVLALGIVAGFSHHFRRLVDVFGTTALAVAALPLLKAFYGGKPESNEAAVLSGSIVVCLLATALMTERRPGAMSLRVLLANTTAGWLTRRLLPAAIIGPIIIGWLRTETEGVGLHDAEFGQAFITVSTVVLLGGLARFYFAQMYREELTERRTSRALARREDLYRTMVETVQEGIWLIDANANTTYVNERMASMLGYRAEDLIGRTPFEFMDDAAVRVAAASIQRGREENKTEHLDSEFRHKDGHIVWVRVATNPLRINDGAFRGALAMITDITARHQMEAALRESEAQFRKVFESNMLGMMFWDRAANIIDANQKFLSIVGYTREDLSGRHIRWDDLTPADWREADDRALAQIAATGSCTPYEKECVRKNGTRFRVLWGGASLGSGAESGVAFVMDMSERQVVQQALKTARVLLAERTAEVYDDVNDDRATGDDLESQIHSVEVLASRLAAANRELESFSYSVSHDLRSPLRAIDGFSKALLEEYNGALDERGRDYLRRVCNATTRMSQLIDDLLRLARLSQKRPRVEGVDLSVEANSVLEELRKASPERAVIANIQPAVTVQADRGLLRIVLENLIGNAWKFTRRQERARIEIGSIANNGVPAYFIRDNGAGFNMSYADKLFAPFQRLHSQEEFDGTGVGLATVQRIIIKHGGRIWADAAVDRGATFYFTLDSARTHSIGDVA